MGITHIIMFPTTDMKSQLAYMHTRDLHTGELKLAIDGHINRAPLVAETQIQKDAIFQQGGAGCFARPNQYAQIISMLLKQWRPRANWYQTAQKGNHRDNVHESDPRIPQLCQTPDCPPETKVLEYFS